MEEAKKILVTGARGMLGSTLCQTLGERYTVYGVDRQEFDITDFDAVHDFFRSTAVDLIIHCAAYTDVDGAQEFREDALRVNVDGTRNMAEAAAERGLPLFFISTDYVFAGGKEGAYREEDPFGPLGVYGETKLKAEEAIAASLKLYYIVRTSWLYGPGGKNFVASIARLARERDVLRVVNDQRGAPTYTVDLSRAIRDMVDMYFNGSVEPGAYHITNDGSCTWFEFAHQIVKMVGARVAIEPITSEQLGRPARRPANSVLSTEKFSSLVGYRMRPWPEALAEYIKDYLVVRQA